MKIGIKTKIITLTLLAGFLPFITVGVLSYRTASLSLKKLSFNQLVSVRELKKKQIEDYFSAIRNQVETFSENKMIVNAMKEFKAAFNEFLDSSSTSASQIEEYQDSLRTYYIEKYANEYKMRNSGRSPDIESLLNQLDDDSVALQHFYISSNKNQLGEKLKLDFADDNSTYSRLHGYYHPVIRNYLEKFGYYDIFLVDSDSGDIVYSVFKELDFSTSLKDGPYANTNLGRVFREVNNSNKQNYTKLIDFEHYPPSYENAASFIASPIFDGLEKTGVLIFQMPKDRINRVMTSNGDWKNVGLGDSGETYLVGDDYTMRSRSRFVMNESEIYLEQVKTGMDRPFLKAVYAKDETILSRKIDTKGTRAALSGETGIAVSLDYRKISVLNAYAPLDIEDLKWAIISEIDMEEALQPVMALRNSIIVIAGIVGVFGILAAIFSARIANSIKRLTEGMKKISDGDLTFKIQKNTNDEIGYLTDSFNRMTLQLNKSNETLEKRVKERTVELTKANESLLMSNSLLSSVVESPDNIIIFALDTSYNYLSYNTAHVKEMKKVYDADIEIGLNILKYIFREDDRLKAEADYKRVLHGERFTKIEEYGKYDCRFWYELIFNPMYDNSNDVTGFTVYVTDITERKKADNELRKLSTAIEQTVATIMITDIHGNIEYVNPKFTEVTGYAREEVIGRKPSILKSGKTSPDEYRQLWETILSGGEWQGELYNKTKSGKLYCEYVVISPIVDSGGDITNFVAVKENITEQKEKDKLFLMQARHAQMGEMISMIAHQWRQPLNTIGAITGDMKNRLILEKLDKEGTVEYLDKLQDQINYLSHTIDDFRHFFKPNKIKELISMGEIINKALSLFSWSLESNRVHIETFFESNKRIMSYPGELTQVLLSILRNTVDKMEEGMVENPLLSIAEYEEDGFVVVDIIDNAGGIPDDIIDDIFLPYFSTKEEQQGVGLGLYMCKNIIEEHCKGSLEVCNYNNGVRTVIRLPLEVKEGA